MDLKILESLMKERGFKRIDLAAWLGRNPSAVTMIFKRQREVSSDEAAVIAHKLNVPIERLYSDDDSPRIPLIGCVNADDEVVLAEKPIPIISDRAVAPNAQALDVMSGNLEGFRLYALPAQLDKSILDDKSYVKLKNGKSYIARKIIKTPKADVYSLLLWQSGRMIENVKIDSISKIKWLEQR